MPAFHPPVYLALGSNLGNRAANLAQAIDRLGERVRVERTSPVYETEPWGVADQPSFLNQTAMGRTALSPHELLRFVLSLEQMMGRVRGERFGPRLIDIDILFYDNLSLTSYSLTIPHPRLIERAFVLRPLADITPDLVHPRLGCSVQELLERVDTSLRATETD